MNVVKPSMTKKHWLSTRNFTVEKELMYAALVGKASAVKHHLLGMRKPTLKKIISNCDDVGENSE
jgi:hypothetical protein